ncbi:3-phosphoserine/phosphohydroxythreonine transaminase [Aliikangiella sp. IMCC44632]
MSETTFNFCAGPAALPKAVMQQAHAEFLDWRGMGVSVMEISHRSAQYQGLAEKAESDLRKLLGVSDEYAVLFLHGGASHQFANIPMSLLQENDVAEYLCNGIWSNKAAKEAARFGSVKALNVVTQNSANLQEITPSESWQRVENPKYTHYTPNETIEGHRFSEVIQSSGAIVADMSSCILSEVININDFDLIYAGAQKNIGPAGMTIVIVKRDLFNQMDFSRLPKIYNYQAQANNGSMVNTPPTYAWYLSSLVFEWLLSQGGVAAMEALAIDKAALLYSCIDSDDFYANPVAIKNRSRMNIPFTLKNTQLDSLFLELAEKERLVGLQGHRSVGGMRASLYNSMPLAGVQALVDFMQEFKRQHG